VPDLFGFVGTGPLIVILAVVIVGLLLFFVASRYKVPQPNEALVISGRREGSAMKVVRGGGVIVRPLLDKVGRLRLTARQINVNLSDAVSRQGIKVAVQGVATFKIGADDESIRNAAERFLDARTEEVDSIVKNVLEGSLRSIVGTLTVEELNLDRQKFQQAVQDAAKGDLATSGLQIDSFTIQAIRDESGYMDLIGQQETARRERDARIAKAAADQEAAVREAEAQQVKINAQRDVELRQAEVLTLTAAAEARALQAGPLAQADAQQEVTRKQTELAELEAARKQKELLASTVRPAEAEAEAAVRRAEGDRQARIAAAQADAERERLAGQAQASVIQAKGEAQAKVVEVNAKAEAQRVSLEGNAEAEITLSKGEAEAKALALRAQAFRQFNEAAVIQTVLGMLPEIVRAAAEPMSSIDNLTVLSNDGASELVKNTTRTVTEASATVKGLTGLDVPALIARAMGDSAINGPDAPPAGGQPGRAPRSRRSNPAAPAGGSGGSTGRLDASPAESMADPAAGEARARAAFDRASATIGRAGSLQPAPASAVPPARMPPPPAVPDLPPLPPTAAEAAARLADELRAIPGIERYMTLRLSDLDHRGPRPVRAAWRIARDRVAGEYGQLTLGELLARFAGRGRAN
jgi:flotillin